LILGIVIFLLHLGYNVMLSPLTPGSVPNIDPILQFGSLILMSALVAITVLIEGQFLDREGSMF
jgi:hypothetical protein